MACEKKAPAHIENHPEISKYYDLGCVVLAKTRPKPKGKKIGRIMIELSDEHDVCLSTLQAARKVAEIIPLSELAKLVERSASLGFAIGKEHVTLLSTIEDPRTRREWTTMMLDGRWSVEDFRDELFEHFGCRSKGRSNFEKPRSIKELRRQLRRLSRKFTFLGAVMLDSMERSAKDVFQKGFEVGPNAKKLIKSMSQALKQLEQILADESHDVEIVWSDNPTTDGELDRDAG